MTTRDALMRFLKQLEADGRSPHTVNQYRRHVRLFAAWARQEGLSRHVEAVGHEDLARFLASDTAQRRATGDGRKKAASGNCLRASLRGFFGYLHEAGYIAENPARLVRRARTSPPPPRGLTDDETRRLLATLDAAGGPSAERDRVLFRLLIATGIRLSSALALDVGDVDLDAGELELRTTKGDRPARVFLGAQTREMLAEYLACRDSGAVFQARNGQRLGRRHAHRRLAQLAQKAGIRRAVSPHALRHSFALDLYERTGDVLLVQAALHHRSLASTMVYARASDERLRSALA